MRNRIPLLACLALGGCDAPPPTLGSATSALTQLSIPSFSTPQFEKMHGLTAEHPSAQLNFELELTNTGSEPIQIDEVDASYTLAAAPFGVSPVVSAADLRSFYLRDCGRAGFGANLTGTLTLDVPQLSNEELSDVQVPSEHVFGTVHGVQRVLDPQYQTKVDVSRFAAVKIEDGRSLGWTTLVPWLGWEDRANALAPADASTSAYVAVGGARPYGGSWQFAAVKLALDGTVAKRGNGTPWKTLVNFPGCSAEALDVERVTISAADDLYFIAGDANCGGDSRIAVALLDGDAGIVWSTTLDPGVLPAHVGGAAVDPATNDLYVVGQFGDHMMVANLTLGGALDPAFGPVGTGYNILMLPTYDRVFGRDAKVLSDGRIAIAAEGRRIADGVTQLGMWRFDATGHRDFALGGTGFVWRSVPGVATARGRDIEVHENETWFTVTGYGEAPGVFVAAAFSATGTSYKEFDRDGYLAIRGAASVTRSFLRGNFITLVGGNGTKLAGVRFHRKDGTFDDPAVLSPGDRCALLWPDTGIVPDGASHATNEWIWNSVPQNAHADVKLHTVSNGVQQVETWGHALSVYQDDPDVEPYFPGERNNENDAWWFVSQGHEIDTKHRRGVDYSDGLGHYVATQRYAYDLTMKRWTGGSSEDGVWTSRIPGSENKLNPANSDMMVYGQPVHPIAEGDIIACSWGTQENANPGASDVAAACNSTGIPCFYGKGGNSIRVLHADGTVSSYYHMQNTANPLCTNAGTTELVTPIHVTRDTVLGLVGNSGQSGGPHLHVEVWAPLPSTVIVTEWQDYLDHAESVPLMFHDIIGVDPSLAPVNFPPVATPIVPFAHFSGSLLRHLPEGEAPAPETTCLETDPLGWPVTDAMQPDGDAPHHNGRPLYCPDDPDTGAVRVCVENQDSTSDCQTCGGETAYPGCPCRSDTECGPNLMCWGLPNGEVASDPSGRCYPAAGVPEWVCSYDCQAQYGTGAWCYSQHPSGQARCMDYTVSEIDVAACWNNMDPLIPNLDYPEEPNACEVECNSTAECRDVLHFPEPYECAPNHVCMIP